MQLLAPLLHPFLFHRFQTKPHRVLLRPSSELQAHWEPSLRPQPGEEARRRGDWTWVIQQTARPVLQRNLLTTQVFEYGFNPLVL